MYLWNVDALVDDFRSGDVTQKEEFKYWLLFTLAVLVAADPLLYIGNAYNPYDSMISVIVLVVTALGIVYCYKINAGGDNRDFIARMTCLGVPVFIRVMAVMIPVALLAIAAEERFFPSANTDIVQTSWIEVPIQAMVMVAYYWYLSSKIRSVASVGAVLRTPEYTHKPRRVLSKGNI